MFHVQPFHIFAFYFVLCCGLVDFLKSSVFCENYTGAQGPPLFKKGRSKEFQISSRKIVYKVE